MLSGINFCTKVLLMGKESDTGNASLTDETVNAEATGVNNATKSCMVISLSGVAIAVSSWRAGADFDHLASITDHLEASLGRTSIGQTVTAATPWWIFSLACGVLVAVSGGALVVSGVNRPRSSSKYERSSVDGVQLSPWQALDQGVDPTSTLDH